MTHIPQYILDIRSINLTKRGMIELCIFPKEAIEDAERAIVTKKDIKSLWHLYFGMCKTYCKDMGIAVDYSIVTRLFMDHGVDQREPRLLNDIVNRPAAAAKPKQSFTQHTLSEDEVEERKRATRERHEREMNEWKVTDPDKYNRIRTREAEFRKILGLNDDGTPVDPANPPSLAKLVALMTGADEASVQGGEAPQISNNGIISSTDTMTQLSLDANPYTKEIL